MTYLPNIPTGTDPWLAGELRKIANYTKNTSALLEPVVRNVRLYGARGDGVTDDTIAIQAAQNSIPLLTGGVLFFPPGRYKTSAPIEIDRHGVTVMGSGRGQNNTIGSQVVTSGGHDGFRFGAFFYLAMHNISVNGPSGAVSGVPCALVRVTRTTHFAMSDVTLLFGYDFLVLDGLFTGDFSNITINNCVSDGVGDSHGILLTDASGRQCQGLRFRGCGIVGFNTRPNSYGIRGFGGSTLDWSQIAVTTWGFGIQVEGRTTDTTWPEFWNWHSCKLELNDLGWIIRSGTRLSHVDCQVTLSGAGSGWLVGGDNTGQYEFLSCKALNNQHHGFEFLATGSNNSSAVVNGCVASGNGQAAYDSYDGLHNAGFNNMTVVGGRFGGGGYAAHPGVLQQRYGIGVSHTGTGGLSVSGTNLQGNVSGGFGTVVTAPGLLATISGCRGYDTGPQLPSHTVAGVPSAASNPRVVIWVSNESGGPVPAVSDGTNWRRLTDMAIIS